MILILPMEINIWLKYFSLISNLYCFKLYSSHYNLGNTSFVLLQLKSSSLSLLSKFPWKMVIVLCVSHVDVWFWWFISFLAHMSNSTACFAVNNQGTECFVGRWLYWNSFGSIYQTQGRLDSPVQIIWIPSNICFYETINQIIIPWSF